MGFDAEVIVIGPKHILLDLEVQDYPADNYDDVDDNAPILGTVAYAESTQDSYQLAYVCGVDLRDLGHHRVECPRWISPQVYIGDKTSDEIYDLLIDLLECEDVQIWFRPEG